MRTLETGIQTAPPAFPNGSRHKIWIDLDNSPHVPFFVPIIEELKQRGYEILLTARDNAQVTELIRWNKLDCRLYGHHYGKNKLFKILGIGMRAVQLAPLILREKPDLALSHVSRSQIVLSSILRIPSLAMTDYEHARMRMVGIRPQWLMVPEVISKTGDKCTNPKSRVFQIFFIIACDQRRQILTIAAVVPKDALHKSAK